MARPAYMEVETVQAMIEARDREEAERRAVILASRRATRARRQGKVDIFLPAKRAWRYFLRQEARARVAFIKEYYPEAEGPDLERATFYRDMLEALTGGLAMAAVYALFIICFG